MILPVKVLLNPSICDIISILSKNLLDWPIDQQVFFEMGV